jgi:hypothetical protein
MMDKLDETAGSQKTPAGNKEGKTSARQVLRLSLTAAISFILATIGLGYAIGVKQSSKWKDRGEVAKFIAIHSTKQFVVALGRELPPEIAPVEVRLRVREMDYVYRTDTQKIIPELVPPSDFEKLKDQSKDNILFMAGGSLANAAAQLLGPSASVPLNVLGKNKIVVLAAAATAGLVVAGAGVWWGFRMGYNPDPDFSTPAFKEKLADTMLWQGLATQFRSDKLRRRQPEAAPSATP